MHSLPSALKSRVGAHPSLLFLPSLYRYVPQLQGILLSHNDHQFMNPTAKIDSDSAFAVSNVRVRCLVWRPRIGMKVGEFFLQQLSKGAR